MIRDNPKHREIAIRSGHELIARAEAAKASGQIDGYMIVVDENDPEITDHLIPYRGHTPSWSSDG